MNKIRIMLVEDHDTYRNGLAAVLNSSADIECEGYATAEKALAALKESVPDVVIMDIDLPGQNGIAGTRIIKEEYPQVQVLICTVYEDDAKIFGALKAGATGYILKRAPLEELFAAIHDVRQGGSPMSSGIARRVVSSFQDMRVAGMAPLSVREEEVLDLLSKGLRMKEIADKLFVSIYTVRAHVRNIYEKLQVQSRVEALNKARRWLS
ncbi:MAG TPA: response regulator transcription factor [Flavobacteriales bacterium]|nr:response regulator transcription factor [Flavobacteriales bacterium]